MMPENGRTVCFGELMLRLSAPNFGHLLQEPLLSAHFGGAEANVAVALARLGMSAAFVSTLPDGAIGEAALDSLRRAGVDVTGVRREPGRLGLYFVTPGVGVRDTSVIYDRLHSVFARTPSNSYDWPRLLDGAACLHVSGIVPALGPDAARLSIEAMQAARAMGVVVSFDGNFRSTLWSRWCVDPGPVLEQHLRLSNILFGNHRDLSVIFGRAISGATANQRRSAASAAFDRFSNLRLIASTIRRIASDREHEIAARIDSPAEHHETDPIATGQIVDRIGTGDAFAAGVLAFRDHGIRTAADAGLRLAVLNHATSGDQSYVTSAALQDFCSVARDVQR